MSDPRRHHYIQHEEACWWLPIRESRPSHESCREAREDSYLEYACD